MIPCLLHFTGVATPPVGIWWQDEAGGGPRSFYMDNEGPEKSVGSQVMSLKTPDAGWEQFFDFLSKGLGSQINGWSSVQVSESPDKFLQRLLTLRTPSSVAA